MTQRNTWWSDMQIENVVMQTKVLLDLIPALQRLLLSFINSVRGRFQIKFGMTSLYKNNGFTLIELLVVVLIIGILTAVAVPQYKKVVRKTRYAEMLSIISPIAHAVQVYQLANGTPPTSLADLDVALPPSASYTKKGIYISFAPSISRIYVTLGYSGREGNGYIYQITRYGHYGLRPGLYCFQSVNWNNGYVKPDGMCTGQQVYSDANGTVHELNP